MSKYKKAYITDFWEHCHLVCEQDNSDMDLNYKGDYACPNCGNHITVYDVEKILDKLMKQIVNDGMEDIIANYTNFVIRTTKGKYKITQHKGDDFWISIPKGRE